MNALIVSFSVTGIDAAAFRGLAESVAPAYAAIPGLISKVWLADDSSSTFGGAYLFESQEAIDNYLPSDLAAGMSSNPYISNISIRSFEVLDSATAITQGKLDLFSVPALA